MGGLVNRGWSLPHPERLLPRVLKDAGHHTVRADFQHAVKNPLVGGFERILEEIDKTDERTVAFFGRSARAAFLPRRRLQRYSS